MFIWDDLDRSFAPPFGDTIPSKEVTRTTNGVTTTVSVLDYYAIITIIVDQKLLIHWYNNQGGRERLGTMISAEDEAEMKIDDARLGVLPGIRRRTTEERIMARVNKILKPTGKGFVWPLVAEIRDFELFYDYMCVWTICFGTPPIRAFTKKITTEERVDMFFNDLGVPERMQCMSTLFGEEFLEVVKPAVLVERQEACGKWLSATGEGETVAARKAKKT
ncbi:hypothetical protein CALVIDRAFT_595708 [Calocera viscosa TUFC12733]|uniref:Uncharacterized protein n=1 Tax=Calocera viscosa (strain TUFC12733) TaxID=1330018 RepID=A0A167QAG7_CALVF|nr:hypothetical protein CALVIDRAFT_595708 [Calocera viscosa TUFC12733]